MKKILVKIIHWINPNYFREMSYSKLEKWGIEDIVNGKLIMKGDKEQMINSFDMVNDSDDSIDVRISRN